MGCRTHLFWNLDTYIFLILWFSSRIECWWNVVENHQITRKLILDHLWVDQRRFLAWRLTRSRRPDHQFLDAEHLTLAFTCFHFAFWYRYLTHQHCFRCCFASKMKTGDGFHLLLRLCLRCFQQQSDQVLQRNLRPVHHFLRLRWPPCLRGSCRRRIGLNMGENMSVVIELMNLTFLCLLKV